MSLQKSSESTAQTSPVVVDESGGYSISIYKGELTGKGIAQGMALAKRGFPALPPSFFEMLIERAKAKGFSDNRLMDAIYHVIDTCPYPTPALANFLSFDRKIKMYDYSQFCSLVTEGYAKWENYDRIKVGGAVFYVSKGDRARYNIPDEI